MEREELIRAYAERVVEDMDEWAMESLLVDLLSDFVYGTYTDEELRLAVEGFAPDLLEVNNGQAKVRT
jgi:hypothetical protein